MKAHSKRRSAFSIYQSHRKTEVETEAREEGRTDKTPGARKRRHEESSTNRSAKRFNKADSTSSKSVNSEETNGVFDQEDHSSDNTETKKGKGKLLSKANKLRQSLTFSSRKKKRQGYHSYDGDLEKSSSSVTINSCPESTDCGTEGDAVRDDGGDLQEEEMEADKLFSWLISPVKPGKFFSDLWEQKPLLVKRHQANYNEGWFSTKEFDDILRQRCVQFSVNLDVTSYKNGVRETHNPRGRALAPVVWDFYENGCSVRLLNPQTFSHSIWRLTSLLIILFSFCRSDMETLPRYSSTNFSEDEIGEPILDTELVAGDVLYFPRGTIHQADTSSDSHSLHITLSTYQKNAWIDFMEKLLPGALQVAFEEDLEFREGLPLNFLNYMGVANAEVNNKGRTEFLKKVEKLMMKLVSHAPVDAAADQLSVGILHDCLPPVLTEEETKKSIFGSDSSWKDGSISNKITIDGETEVRLIRRGVARLVVEGECVNVYHTLENSRVYHENELDRVEFGLEAGPMVEIILASFPEYIKVSDLPHDDINYKVRFLFVFLLVCIVVFGVSHGQFTETTYKKETNKNKMENHISVDYLLSIGRLLVYSRPIYRPMHL
ncbi:PREDICTED: bifunctional lysine-specific demethylase and histidyl-hydroxylase NO66-like [Acropora digitifera]|uniref:bifunctional lysine-specific demethylase and histidyl-hydroxylase NO66-like n=1 Tax=Acropora digitifera TaxID=70779 RepID=UPI00077AEE4F|nr:PREDICTED: bifunctional lysine-specific demethylase and histidyl-hydroxylase NO66-like [Acropora digitifera]